MEGVLKRRLIISIILLMSAIGVKCQSAFFALAQSYAKEDNYVEAIRLTHKAIEQDSVIYGKGTVLMCEYVSLGRYYKLYGDIQNAIEYTKQAVQLADNTIGHSCSEYAIIVDNLGHYYSLVNDYENAIHYANIAAEILVAIQEARLDYAICLRHLFFYEKALDNKDKALDFGMKSLELYKSLGNEYLGEYAIQLDDVSSCLYSMNRLDDAFNMCVEAIEILSELPLYKLDLAIAQGHYSNMLYENDMYEEAISFGKSSLNNYASVYSPETADYLTKVNNQRINCLNRVSFNIEKERPTLIMAYCTWFFEITEDPNTDGYPFMTHAYSVALSSIDKNNEAIELEKRLVDYYEKTNILSPDYIYALFLISKYALSTDRNDCFNIISINNKKIKTALPLVSETLAFDDIEAIYRKLALDYAAIEDFNGQLSVYIDIKSLYESNGKNKTYDYAVNLSNIGTINLELGNYVESCRSFEEAKELKEYIYGNQSMEYFITAENYAFALAYLDFNKSIKIMHELEESFIQNCKVSKEEQAKFFIELARIHSSTGNYFDRLKYGDMALKIYKEIFPDFESVPQGSTEDYLRSLVFLANNLISLGEIEERIKRDPSSFSQSFIDKWTVAFSHESDYFNRAKQILEPLHLTKLYHAHVEATNLLSYIYMCQNSHDKALPLLENLYGKLYNQSAINTNYLSVVETLLLCYQQMGLTDRCESIVSECVNKIRDNYISEFSIGVASERQAVKQIYNCLVEDILPLSLYKSEPKNTSLLYNLCLLNKSLLLDTSNTFRKMANEDPNLSKLFQEIQSLNSLLEKETNSGTRESISTKIENKERLLLSLLPDRNNVIDLLSCEWEDVRGNLLEDDIAIEFKEIEDTTSCHVIALVINKSSTVPKLITLLNDENVITHESYIASKDTLYDLIWRPLAGELEGKRNIYFSADGILHQIGIEYALLPDGSRMCDRYNIYRLSSTRELAQEKVSKSRLDNAVLFGGFRYDLAEDEFLSESRKTSSDVYIASRALEMENQRFGVNNLAYTQIEVDSIAENFSKNNLQRTVITGVDGTEETFKALAHQSPSIIHLATHGFFWSAEKAKQHDYIRLMALSLDQGVSDEEQALLRSGLLFSGANLALKGVSLPDDVEDGILTAKELSMMNLGDVDLVVMSACQSGLGKTTGEGVFGLQRGFKLAGAKSLLMSLWKVDDEATCLLMTEFYRHYLSGKTKQESLYLAQKILRESSEFSDPEYWAAFILLDALN